ncbi:unnamed protein product [Parnassius mnemosyne]|uniref:Uncharacterized protein n=1 Tax=Parnassius mnemosyne TaxID=213953 RepID=A0AAV1KSI5_9NEOP
MQQKWKCIIANWINCYFYDNNNKNYFELNHKSLLNIIYQLRENFNLDESKSSIFSGHSLEEFIQEKYPGFRFENGTVEAYNEEEIYIAASLLLFFVCVNSKDVDIKSAMCSKLSTSDQEIILKFSKSLMKCSLVSSSDVIAAITEACGPDMANGEGSSGQVTVAETPPALRSLHSEVRRLQAALEAERFDRNYLQDELTRTNLKVEKLLKDKEKYKLDIVNLKAKISMCCGQESEAREGETKNSETAKFTKQLEQMEQRVIDVQEQLEEAQHERDMLKAKLDDLKGECDRLLMVNQQETSRAAQLAEELEAEKRQSQTLRELVVELRQHNHRNGLDSSMLECDDTDTSVTSLQRSFSVCSEVCANVVEVQLGEERAKSLALKQQIQMLQDQMNEQLQTIEKFKEIISEKDDYIFNLKHRINEEIEEKNNLKHYFDREVTKLNNSVNELEQKIKDNNEHSRQIIEKKIQEIQIIQEEKLSLLQSLSDETTKLENIIKDLKMEINAEKTSKIKMKDDYENHIMKLKEKVLNRNNELVELQNNVLQKSEMIERLSLELRKEREIKDETINKHNNDIAFLNAQKISVEKELQNKCTEVTELLKQIRQRDDSIKDMAKDLKYAKESASKLIEDCKILEETRQTLLNDIQNRQVSAEKMRKEFDNLTNKHCEEKDKLQYKFDEMCAMVKSLQTQLQNEIDFKMGIQHDLEKTQGVITKLSNTNTKLHSELTEINTKLEEKDGIVKEKELALNVEKETYSRLKQEYDHVKVELDKLSSDVALKDKTIQECEDKLQKLNKSFQEEVSNREKIIDSLKEDLKQVVVQKESFQDSIKTLSHENNKLVKSFNEKCSYVSQLESERETLSKKMEEKGATINMLEQKLNDKMLAFVQIENNFGIEISKLVTKVSETEKILKEIRTQSDSIIEKNETQIQKLNGDIFKLQGKIEASVKEKTKLESEKERLEQKLEEITLYNSNIVKECQDNCKTMEKQLEKLKHETVIKDKEINDLNRKNILLSSSIKEKEKELSILQDTNLEWKTKKDIMDEYLKNENERLLTMLEEQSNKNKEIEEELKVKVQTIYRLEEKLYAFESNIGTLEKEKDNYLTILAKLEKKENELENEKMCLEREKERLVVERNEIQSKFEILKKEFCDVENEMIKLKEEKSELLNVIEKNKSVISEMEKNIQSELNDKEELCHALTVEKSKLSTECTLLQEQQLKDAKTIAKQSKELNELQQELNTYSNRMKYLEKAKTEQDSFITTMEQQKNCLETEKEHLTNEKRNYLNEIAKLKEEIEVLKNAELPKLKEENLNLTKIVEENKTVIDDLEKRLKHESGQNDILRQNYDSDKINLLNNCESLQKNVDKAEQELQNRNIQMNQLKDELEAYISKAETLEEELKQSERKLIEINEQRDTKLKDLTKDLENERAKTLQYKKEIGSKDDIISGLEQRLGEIEKVKKEIETLRKENEEFIETLRRKEEECTLLQSENDEWKIKKDMLEVEFESEKNALQHALKLQMENNQKLERDVLLKEQYLKEIEEKLKVHDITINELKSCKNVQDKLVLDLEKEKTKLKDENGALESEKCRLVQEKNEYMTKLNKLQTEFDVLKNEKLTKLKEENLQLTSIVENNKTVISTLERLIKAELEQNELLRKDYSLEKLELVQKCKFLQENHTKVEQELEKRNTEINALKGEIRLVTSGAKGHEDNLRYNNEQLTKIIEEKDAAIHQMNEVLLKEKIFREEYQKQIELKENNIYELQQKLKELEDEVRTMDVLRSENKELVKHVKQIESNAASSQENYQNQKCCQADKHQLDLHPQVDTTSSTNHTHSSMESNKTISDLEKILNDKNRTITALQCDITFLKSLMAESENKVLDVTKELEISTENCQQLSNQLKKIVHQKNEEISDLKRQVSKMSATENRASQIIKVSAKYQEMILKRIAEIKCNTVLKELTNFGNATNCDNDLKRSLNAGTITMEDLENFLETTDRHLRRCSEKRIALQKERDRLVEVNRINESEIINIKKFLTELSLSVKTFNSVKDIYTQKLSRVVSLQRTVRREVLSMEGRLTDSAMCKLERGYAAVLQDLVECTMNLERWVERSIARAISAEKIKQAFTSENERASLAPSTFQNASLEVQMDELEKSFHKLLEEVARAQKGDGAKDAQSLTVQELRAEYEDKLTRMKAKMKELYYEQIDIFKAKQREEIIMLEQELQKTRDKLEESSKAYEEHIRSLSIELWKLGEKFLDKKDEAEWLRRKQRSESLMSLQHVHSTGLTAHPEVSSRASDTHSLRSLPVNINKKREGRGLHMSDEEGEVFDNRCLRELATPRRSSPQRLSELRYRNSLCPPHLKSSYPAETQFVPALHEDDIKAGPTNSSVGVRQQRKEVGITAYKKPGPPTPSKQAGRLSATDSELRESLRVEADPHASRKTATPSRLRSFFGTARNDTIEGTPRSRRLSNFFRKK